MRWLILLAALMAAGVAAAQPVDRTISLTRMGASLRDGETYGRMEAGPSCNEARTLTWDGNSSRFEDAGFKQAFRYRLTEAGFKMTGSSGGERDLFGPRPVAADLQVGALITRLRVRTCTPRFNGESETDGSVSMDVEWQIYSPEEGKVVARITTSRSAGVDGPLNGIIDRLLTQAFARNAEELAGHPTFVKLMKPPAATQVAQTPLEPLAVAFVAARATPIADSRAAVVSIVANGGLGSGVLISSDGYILTNHHVAGASGKVKVVWADGSEAAGDVVRADRKRDVALVKVGLPKAKPLALRSAGAQVGETVFAVGTPLDRELAGTLTRGVVSASRTMAGQPFIQSDVAVTHGNSGGPLLDERGQVIGLCVSGIEPDGAPLSLNFFIPIQDALKVLEIRPAA